MSEEKIIPLPGSRYARGVVLVNPATGEPYAAGESAGSVVLVADSGGGLFDPASCAHAYGYTGGLLTTDVATGNDSAGVGASWTKTYTYTPEGLLLGETKWVRA